MTSDISNGVAESSISDDREKQYGQRDSHHGNGGDGQPDVAAEIDKTILKNTFKGYELMVGLHFYVRLRLGALFQSHSLYFPTALSLIILPSLMVTTRRFK